MSTENELEKIEHIGQVVLGFPRDVVNSLWEQGVNMDDWDYAILIPPERLELEAGGSLRLFPTEYAFERMLNGCCDNRWYRVIIRGQPFGMGLAYHA